MVDNIKNAAQKTFVFAEVNLGIEDNAEAEMHSWNKGPESTYSELFQHTFNGAVPKSFTVNTIIGSNPSYYMKAFKKELEQKLDQAVSADGAIDTTKEYEKVEGIFLEAMIEKVRSFVENSGKADTWLECDDDVALSFFYLITQECGREDVKKLLQDFDWKPLLENDAVLKKWMSYKPDTGYYGSYINKFITYHWMQKYTCNLDLEALAIKLIQKYPDESSELLSTLIAMTGNNPSGKLAAYLFKDPQDAKLTEYLSNAFLETWAKAIDQPDPDYNIRTLIKLAKLGHPFALGVIDDLISKNADSVYFQMLKDHPDFFLECDDFNSFVMSAISEMKGADKVNPAFADEYKKTVDLIGSKIKDIIYSKDAYYGALLLGILEKNVGQWSKGTSGTYKSGSFAMYMENMRNKPDFIEPSFDGVALYLIENNYYKDLKFSQPLIQEGFRGWIMGLFDIAGSGKPVGGNAAVYLAAMALDDHNLTYFWNEDYFEGKGWVKSFTEQEKQEYVSKIRDFFAKGISPENLYASYKTMDNAFKLQDKIEKLMLSSEEEFPALFTFLELDDGENFLVLIGKLDAKGRYGHKPLDILTGIVLGDQAGADQAWKYIVDDTKQLYGSESEAPAAGYDKHIDAMFEIAQSSCKKSLPALKELLSYADSDESVKERLGLIDIDHIVEGKDFSNVEIRGVVSKLALFNNEGAVKFLLEQFGNGSSEAVTALKACIDDDSFVHADTVIDAIKNVIQTSEDEALKNKAVDLLYAAADKDRPGAWEIVGELATADIKGGDVSSQSVKKILDAEGESAEREAARSNLDAALSEYIYEFTLEENDLESLLPMIAKLKGDHDLMQSYSAAQSFDMDVAAIIDDIDPAEEFDVDIFNEHIAMFEELGLSNSTDAMARLKDREQKLLEMKYAWGKFQDGAGEDGLEPAPDVAGEDDTSAQVIGEKKPLFISGKWNQPSYEQSFEEIKKTIADIHASEDFTVSAELIDSLAESSHDNPVAGMAIWNDVVADEISQDIIDYGLDTLIYLSSETDDAYADLVMYVVLSDASLLAFCGDPFGTYVLSYIKDNSPGNISKKAAEKLEENGEK